MKIKIFFLYLSNVHALNMYVFTVYVYNNKILSQSSKFKLKKDKKITRQKYFDHKKLMVIYSFKIKN